jgi:hypothetical protein
MKGLQGHVMYKHKSEYIDIAVCFAWPGLFLIDWHPTLEQFYDIIDNFTATKPYTRCVCLCDQQAHLTQPDFIPIHTHCWLVLSTLQVQVHGAFHLLYDCFGFLAGVGWLFSFSFIFMFY